jgi:CheY-like chemotaxis protein
VFTVRLPAMSLADATAAPIVAIAAQPPRRIHRILVADDSHDGAESLAALLQLGGHEVDVAYDGEEALKLAEARRPDIALLDIGMPKLTGLEVCQRIRAQPWGAAMKLVAQTGWGQEEDRRRTRDAGFDQHLVKPVEPAALDALLEALAKGDPPSS